MRAADALGRVRVDYLVTGPYSGQYLWIMGPGTFTSLDGRPTGDPHDSDWAEVLAHADGHSNIYWRRNENLSTPLPESDAAVRPVPFTGVGPSAIVLSGCLRVDLCPASRMSPPRQMRKTFCS